MSVKMKDIEQYLSEVREAVSSGRWRIALNERREDNLKLFVDYVIYERDAKEIILNLEAIDFSEILQNEKVGFGHELLYVFGKDVTLLERYGKKEKSVSLYIKFNKLENYLIVVSFHEQERPLRYCFK